MNYEVLKYSIVDEEIMQVVAFYETISLNIGLAFEAEVQNALNKLERNPKYYFVLEDGKHRRKIIGQFPYAFIYSIEDTFVIVKMLFPQKEDPAKLWTHLGSL
jgi:hypothetical protein